MSPKSIRGRLAGLFKTPKPSPPAPMAKPLHNTPPIERAPLTREQILAELRERIRDEVAAGFDDAEEIIDRQNDQLADESDDPTLRPYVAQFTAEELELHKQQQGAWPAKTDCDRLDEAFAELNQIGIVARQNFSCCQTCGNDEIMDEVKAAEQNGANPHGYTYYHMQDTGSAVHGSGIYLAYAGRDDALAVANEIVATLQRHGLQPQWDGSLKTRIFIPLDWKRRR